MVELHPNVFVSPRLTARARSILWDEVLPFGLDPGFNALLVWEDTGTPERIRFEVVGAPKRLVTSISGMLMSASE